MSFDSIEKLAKDYSVDYQKLADEIADLDAEVAAATRKRMTRFRQLVGRVAEKKAKLHAEITAHPELFEKPRTQIFHGIKTGHQKGKPSVEISNPSRTCELIKEKRPDDVHTLTKTTTTPVKNALLELSAGELRSIGCRFVSADDSVVIKSTDSQIEKSVNAMLKDKSMQEVNDGQA